MAEKATKWTRDNLVNINGGADCYGDLIKAAVGFGALHIGRETESGGYIVEGFNFFSDPHFGYDSTQMALGLNDWGYSYHIPLEALTEALDKLGFELRRKPSDRAIDHEGHRISIEKEKGSEPHLRCVDCRVDLKDQPIIGRGGNVEPGPGEPIMGTQADD